MKESLILVCILLVLLFIRVPVALAMIATSMVGIWAFIRPEVLTEIGWIAWLASSSWLLVCLPLFFLMADFLGRGGISETLFEGASKFTSGVRGALAYALVIGCTLFGLTTGTGLAEIAAIGRISVPAMLKRGYQPELTLGGIASVSALGFIIPPSLFLIIYGAWAGISIGELFAAGLIPGLLVAAFMMVSIAIRVQLHPAIAPKIPGLPLKERILGLFSTWPIVLLGGSVLTLIFAGIATPTEAAGIGAILALVITLARKSSRKFVNWDYFKESFFSAAILTSVIMFIIVGAQVLSYTWAYLGIPMTIARWVSGLGLSQVVVIIAVYVVILILGCFIDAISIMVLTLPVLVPLLVALGFNTTWFGVMFGILIGSAQITPPFALGIFTVQSLFPEQGYGFWLITRGTIPFMLSEWAAIVVLTIFPQIALWLPGVLYH